MAKQIAKPATARKVAVVLVDGCPIFEAAVPCEVFGQDRSDIAGDEWYEMSLCSQGSSVQLRQGFSAITDPLSAIDDAGIVIVPGCSEVHDDVPQPYIDALVSAAARGARIVSLCSGAFVLAQAGLLDGRSATTHWMHADTMRHRYPGIFVNPSVIYIQDGNIWTSAGTAAGIDLCLEIVRADFGAAIANEVAARIVIAPHRTGTQAQFYRRTPLAPTDGSDRAPLPEDTLAWARERLAHGLTVQDLVERAHTSQRTLTRRFHVYYNMSPKEWILNERLRLACMMLETHPWTVAAIAQRSGFGTAENLRLQFKKNLDCSPHDYRTSFAARRAS